MSTSLNVIALISGGKDSLYSVLHCMQNGHEVVALANLYPPSKDDSPGADGGDMNSFMYQTVGHSIISLYEEALGLPLYRKEITGTAQRQHQDYDTSTTISAHDETEDLFLLLQDVKEKIPHANAVCSGAILSTYQRTRVESVATRLGLTPLAYLWQYPALPPPPERADSLTGLLDDMEAAECSSRLIKVASGGIKESMLWTNVASSGTRKRLVAGLSPFYSNQEMDLRGGVLGEGGEYETLAVSGPPAPWKKRLCFDDEARIVALDSDTSYAQLPKAYLVDNDGEHPDGPLVRQPTLLDPQFKQILQAHHTFGKLRIYRPKSTVRSQRHDQGVLLTGSTVNASAQHLTLSNMTSVLSSSAFDQMVAIVQRLKTQLSGMSPEYSLSQLLFTFLLLSDMGDFAAVNMAYASMFLAGQPNPPARVTVAARLPPGVKVSMSVILDKRITSAKRGLHVQSRSHWAPANIGPYSQAIYGPLPSTVTDTSIHARWLPEVVHMAGQIPLVPHTMELLNQCFCYQAILSLQHLWRVAQERKVDIWPCGVALLAESEDIANRAALADAVWSTAKDQRAHNEDLGEEETMTGFDVWYQQRLSGHPNLRPSSVGNHLHTLPNPKVYELQPDFHPPLVMPEVRSLPRDASIEWWSTGIANAQEDVRCVTEWVESEYGLSWLLNVNPGIDYQLCNTFYTVLITHDNADGIMEAAVRELYRSSEGSLHVKTPISGTCFIAADASDTLINSIKTFEWSKSLTIIACRGLWGSMALVKHEQFGDKERMKPLKAALLMRLEDRYQGEEREGLWMSLRSWRQADGSEMPHEIILKDL